MLISLKLDFLKEIYLLDRIYFKTINILKLFLYSNYFNIEITKNQNMGKLYFEHWTKTRLLVPENIVIIHKIQSIISLAI